MQIGQIEKNKKIERNIYKNKKYNENNKKKKG